MVYFLIPAYEEEGTLGLLLYKVREVMREVRRDYVAIVLDDGSPDGTAQVAEQYRRFLPVKLLRHAENRGFGASLDRLVREAARQSRYPERDIAIVLEADFTNSPDAVPAMVREIEAGADVVIGARTHHESRIEEAPGAKQFGARVVSTILRAVMPLPRPMMTLISDTPEINKELRKYFRDVQDHLARVTEQVNSFDDLLISIMQARLAQVTVDQNNDMRKIASWAAIAAVWTAIAGVYGMNFVVMPELEWKYGYPLVIGVMVAISYLVYRSLRRNGWL